MYLSSRPWAQACNESKKDLRWSSISLIGDWWRNVMRNVIASHDVIEFDVIDSNQLLYPYGTWRTPLCVWSAIRFCSHNFRNIENSFFFESTVNYYYGTWRTPLFVWSAIRFCFHNFWNIENSIFFLDSHFANGTCELCFQGHLKMCPHMILFLVTIGWPLYHQCHIDFFL